MVPDRRVLLFINDLTELAPTGTSEMKPVFPQHCHGKKHPDELRESPLRPAGARSPASRGR